MSWSIAVDADLCQSHGVCEMEAPGIFDAPRRGTVRLSTERPGDDRRNEVEAAVRYCPTHALKIIDQEDDGDALSP